MSNGISTIDPQASRSVLTEATASREVAAIQSQMVIAKKFPRDEVMALDKILNACQRKTLAESATYQYARGGTEISGPSIRLAETMARYWGNLEFGLRELEQRHGESTVEAYAIDLETNVRRQMTFQVKHERHTRNGTTQLKDPRDIYELVANQGSRRVRACILAIIPGDVQEAALEECDRTLTTHAEVTPERLKAMLDRFAEYGVTKEQVEARIQRRIDAMTPAQLLSLGRIYNSLRDGMSKAGDWFESEKESGSKIGESSVNERLKKPRIEAPPAAS